MKLLKELRFYCRIKSKKDLSFVLEDESIPFYFEHVDDLSLFNELGYTLFLRKSTGAKIISVYYIIQEASIKTVTLDHSSEFVIELTKIQHIVNTEEIRELLKDEFEYLAIDKLLVDSDLINNNPSSKVFSPYNYMFSYVRDGEFYAIVRHDKLQERLYFSVFSEAYNDIPVYLFTASFIRDELVEGYVMVGNSLVKFQEFEKLFPFVSLTIDNYLDFGKDFSDDNKLLMEAAFI